MTDKLHLFRGPLIHTKRIPIQVGGGELYSCQRGTVVIECEDGSSGLVEGALYVPKLGVNLISAKRLCKNGLKGSFDSESIHIKDGRKTVIYAQQNRGLYIVKHISKRYKEKALAADQPEDTLAADQPEDTQEMNIKDDNSEEDPDNSEDEKPATKAQRRLYRLMHRRFGHYGPGLIRNLHKVTTLKNKIRIPPPERRVCGPCKLAKMRNKISKKLARHKAEVLQLISLDIAGPFTKSLRGNRYFMQIIDNYTRKNWSIPL
jgi:hypothetical protein